MPLGLRAQEGREVARPRPWSCDPQGHGVEQGGAMSFLIRFPLSLAARPSSVQPRDPSKEACPAAGGGVCQIGWWRPSIGSSIAA